MFTISTWFLADGPLLVNHWTETRPMRARTGVATKDVIEVIPLCDEGDRSRPTTNHVYH